MEVYHWDPVFWVVGAGSGGRVILGVGIDVVEVARMAAALRRHGAHFEERIFTDAERAACSRRGDRVLALAARFAAKEACLKALGTGWAEGVGFRDVEIVRVGNDPPRLVLRGEAARRAEARGVVRSHVSLTHQPGLAAAVVVLES
jgi:holo-[acyl-carrier protein] synthase